MLRGLVRSLAAPLPRFCAVEGQRGAREGRQRREYAASHSTNVRGDIGAAGRAAKDVANPLPPPRHELDGHAFAWERAQDATAPRDLTPALEDTTRTEEYRRRVAGWTPLVKVVADRRLRVALVGRMNSGKSSLFNLLSRQEVPLKNIVKDFEGITRDSVDAAAELGSIAFTVIDTPGLVKGKIIEEAMQSIESADLVVFVSAVDQDITRDEVQLARLLTAKRLPTLLLVNKVDLVAAEDEDRVLEAYEALGLGAPLPFSCREREGEAMLEAALLPFWHLHLMRQTEADWSLEDLAVGGDEEAMETIRDRNAADRFIRVAIVGRSNSGKSSLLNRLVGFERTRAADQPNTTRDPVEIPCVYRGHKLRLIDTAGMARVHFRRERDFLAACHRATERAINFAHVCVLVFDATEGHPNQHDLSILHKCAREGRPVVLAANKWDAVLDTAATAEAIDFKLKRQVREAKYCNAVVVSAHSGLNLTLLLDQALELHDTWNRRVSTSELTRFWRKMEKSVVIPHHVSRIRSIHQINTRPPTFRVKLQTRDDSSVLPPIYVDLLKNAIIEEFGFRGVPIRIIQEVKDSMPDYI